MALAIANASPGHLTVACLTKVSHRFFIFPRSVVLSSNNPSRIRFASHTVAANVVANQTHRQSDQPQRDPLDLTFTNAKEAYKSKKTWELIRGWFVLKLSTYDFLVYNHSKLIKLGKTVLGTHLFRLLMKNTFYGQFVAGEDEVKIRPTLDHLRSFGVKSILDYSAEEDISEEQAVDYEMSSAVPEGGSTQDPIKQYQAHEEFADRRKFMPVARTYFYLGEANCEKNLDIFLKSIDAVANATYGTGFVAIKLTALGRPALLLQLSEVIARVRQLYTKITGEKSMALSHITPEEFQRVFAQRFNIEFENEDVKQWFKRMDYDQRGMMNIFSWNGLIDMKHLVNDLFKVPNLSTGRLERIITSLTKEEEEMFKNMMRRIHHLAKCAKEKDVRILIDAEQTYFQPAINRITMELMRKYNNEKAIIFNTYQCYLKNAYDTAVIDIGLAKRQNFYFGAKLVRGAYMDQERERAKQVGYEDPINSSYEETNQMYHKTLEFCMQKIVDRGIESKKIAVMVASHNEDSVRFTVEKMKEYGIEPEHKVICFGQLYGMCDQISFLLGQSGYSVYKYVPYGPVEEVLPYLSRRAIENHGIIEKSHKERSLLLKEFRRRLLTGDWFYKPVGNYKPI